MKRRSDTNAASDRRRRVEQSVLAVPRFIVGTLVLLTVAISGANVVARYVFLSPFFWAEEFLTYVMITFVFLGAILVTWDGGHLKMDILTQMLRPPWKQAVNVISAMLFLAVCGFIAVQSYEVAVTLGRFGKHSVAADFPMVIPHSMVLLCFVSMIVVVVYRFRDYIRGELGSQIDELAEEYADKTQDPEPGDDR